MPPRPSILDSRFAISSSPNTSTRPPSSPARMKAAPVQHYCPSSPLPRSVLSRLTSQFNPTRLFRKPVTPPPRLSVGNVRCRSSDWSWPTASMCINPAPPEKYGRNPYPAIRAAMRSPHCRSTSSRHSTANPGPTAAGLARFEKSWCTAEVHFKTEDFPEPSTRNANHALCVPIAFSGSANVVSPPNVNPMNGRNCHSAPPSTAPAADGKYQTRRAHHRTNKFKNSRANGDKVTSPFSGEYRFTRPSLFAIRMTRQSTRR